MIMTDFIIGGGLGVLTLSSLYLGTRIGAERAAGVTMQILHDNGFIRIIGDDVYSGYRTFEKENEK